MLYDVMVMTDDGGWSTDMTTGGRRFACQRAQDVAKRSVVVVRVIDMYGGNVDYFRDRAA